MTSEIGNAKRDLGRIDRYHSEKIEYWKTEAGKRDKQFWENNKEILTRWDKALKIIERYEAPLN